MTLITANQSTAKPNQIDGSSSHNTTNTHSNEKSLTSTPASQNVCHSFAAQIYNGASSIFSNTLSYISSLTAAKIHVEDKPHIIRGNLNRYKTLLTPAAFPKKEIEGGRPEAYNIPYYANAKIKDVHGTRISDKAEDTHDKILDAQQFLSFLRNNFQLNDMLGHHDKFLLLATLQNLRKDLADKPHLKKEIGEQFAIIKQKLMEKIDNPQPTSELRGGFATQGKEDLVLAISQDLQEQGKTQSQINEHLEKIQQETTSDPIKAKALVDKYAYFEIKGQEQNLTLWALEDINMPFSPEQENAIRNMKLA